MRFLSFQKVSDYNIFPYLFFSNLFLSTSSSFLGSSGHLTWVRHSSHKTSATHSCQCAQYFLVSKQWHDCQCLGYLTYVQMLTPAIAHGGCTDTVWESALEVDWEKNPVPSWGREPMSVLWLDFQLDALPTELFYPNSCDFLFVEIYYTHHTISPSSLPLCPPSLSSLVTCVESHASAVSAWEGRIVLYKQSSISQSFLAHFHQTRRGSLQ